MTTQGAISLELNSHNQKLHWCDTLVQIPMQQTLPKVDQAIISYERVHLWLLLVCLCWGD